MKLPHLYTERAGSRTYYYVRRRRGERIRISAAEGSAEFFRQYADAIATLEEAARAERLGANTMRWLASQYFAWHGFTTLHASTQQVRRNVIEQFMPRVGRDDYRKVDGGYILRLLDEKANAGKPEAAQTRLKALRALFDFAQTRALVKDNPARDPAVTREMRTVHSHRGGHKTWTLTHLAQYRAHWPVGTKQRLALEIFFWTGARVSDVCRMGWQQESRRGGWIMWREMKGRSRYPKPPTAIPLAPQLREVLDATPHGDMVWLATEWGKPFTTKGLGQWFVRSARAAGLRGLTAHGVRKAAATIAANNGASEHELMAMFGWSSPRQAAVYTKNVDRDKLAESALAKLAGGEYKRRTP